MEILYKGVKLTPKIKEGKVVFSEIPNVRWEIRNGGRLKTGDYINTDLSPASEIWNHSINRNQNKIITVDEEEFKKIEKLLKESKKSELDISGRFLFNRKFNGNKGFFYAEFANKNDEKEFERFYSILFEEGDEKMIEKCGVKFTASLFTNRKGAKCVDLKSILRIN
jgi:hypothetical protein